MWGKQRGMQRSYSIAWIASSSSMRWRFAWSKEDDPVLSTNIPLFDFAGQFAVRGTAIAALTQRLTSGPCPRTRITSFIYHCCHE